MNDTTNSEQPMNKKGIKRVLVMIEHHDANHPEHGAVYDVTALAETLPDKDRKEATLYSIDMSLNVYASRHNVPMQLRWRTYKGDGSGFCEEKHTLAEAMNWGAAESERVKWLKSQADKLKIEASKLMREAAEQHKQDVASLPPIQPVCRIIGTTLPMASAQ